MVCETWGSSEPFSGLSFSSCAMGAGDVAWAWEAVGVRRGESGALSSDHLNGCQLRLSSQVQALDVSEAEFRAPRLSSQRGFGASRTGFSEEAWLCQT